MTSGAPAGLEEVLRGLAEPGAYPHEVRDLRVIQTHAAVVILTGPYAYKVKKPVNLGFLDYSTLERRRHFCEQEVLLNHRLCPEVYHGVVPIIRNRGRLCIGGGGEPVEWAVRMRQLPDADLLSRRLAEQRVGPEEIRSLARVLAGFHGRAQSSPHIREFGTPQVIARNLEENFAQTEARTNHALPAAHLAEVREYSRSFLAAAAPLLQRRVDGGWIRDGHGDLRAQNIWLSPGICGGVQVLDCIEFNERFRFQDVMADLAYLAMDLDLAGRRDLREWLIQAYSERLSDLELPALLPFYQCYRAYVRGKIALLAAAEPEIPAEQAARETELAACAFDLARSYAGLSDRPWLLVMTGIAGTGKSVLARELARRLPAVVFSSDAVRKQMAGAAPARRLGNQWYAPARIQAVYRELRHRAGETLERGVHTILDATFLSPAERTAAARLAAEHGAAFRIVECECPPEVARGRIEARRERGTDASDADLAVYESQRRQWLPVPEELAPAAIRVQTNQPPGELARAVMDVLWHASEGSGCMSTPSTRRTTAPA